MWISSILLPVEFSDRCRGAARCALAMAHHFGSRVTVLHVVMPPFAIYGGAEAAACSSVTDTFPQRLAELKRRLESFCGENFGDVEVSRVVLEGDPPHRIVEYAHTHRFDLIMMPTHGYGPFRRFLLGSVTAKVLHDAECPVWTGPHMEEVSKEPLQFHNVLCALDLGPHSRPVLRWADGVAREFGAGLTVLHVIPISEVRLGGAYFDPEWRVELANNSRQQICWLLQDMQVKADVSVQTGDVPATVRDVARSLNAGLMVIGRSGPGLSGRLRTNAYAILRESPCSVASV